MFLARDTLGKNGVLKSETLNLFQNNGVNSLSFFFSLQIKFIVHPCILIHLCRLIPFSKYQSVLFLAALDA